MTTFTTEDRLVTENDVDFLVEDLLATITQSYTPEFLVQKAANVLRKQKAEIDYWKNMFEKSMKVQEK